jgi:hypothetical protein
MFEINLRWAIETISWCLWGIIIVYFTKSCIKKYLKKEDGIISIAVAKKNWAYYLFVYFFFLLTTLFNCALVAFVIYPLFLKIFVITSILSVPVVLNSAFKEIQRAKKKS